MSRIQGQIVWEGQTEEGREGAEVGYNVPFFLRIMAEYVAGILDDALPMGCRFLLKTDQKVFTNHTDPFLTILLSVVYYLDDWLDRPRDGS